MTDWYLMPDKQPQKQSKQRMGPKQSWSIFAKEQKHDRVQGALTSQFIEPYVSLVSLEVPWRKLPVSWKAFALTVDAG